MPFDGAVKLTGITVIGGPDGTSPSKLKVLSQEQTWHHSKPSVPPAAHFHCAACRPLPAPGRHACCVPLQVFINRDDLDFASAGELPAVQEWDLLENLNGQIEYPTRQV